MKNLFLILLLCLSTLVVKAQDNYVPHPENLEARKWFEEAKFGMFIHWGVYSILGYGEWVMNNQNIAIENYENLPQFFNPTKFDAEKWVRLAKEAGMKYITITSRHHDGFSMFNSGASGYNIVARTPFGRDILKELSEACRKEDIKLFFYYSLLDWRHRDYYPHGKTGKGIPDGSTDGNWVEYITFMKAQLTELLTNYGEIGGIWFDGHWDKPEANWHYEEIYQLIHDLQPQALIGNNHHSAPKDGEDFQMFEKDLPGKNTKGYRNDPESVGALPKETCETINNSWGFNLQDGTHKTDKQLIRYLIQTAGYGANFLLNVGPMPNGEIQEDHKENLKSIGDWLKQYGDLIYGTKQGPIPTDENFVSTEKHGKIYLHLLDNQEPVFIKKFDAEIESVSFYDSGREAQIERTGYGTFIKVPKKERNDIATILEITLK